MSKKKKKANDAPPVEHPEWIEELVGDILPHLEDSTTWSYEHLEASDDDGDRDHVLHFVLSGDNCFPVCLCDIEKTLGKDICRMIGFHGDGSVVVSVRGRYKEQNDVIVEFFSEKSVDDAAQSLELNG